MDTYAALKPLSGPLLVWVAALVVATGLSVPSTAAAQDPGAALGGLGGEDTFINDFRSPGEPSMTVYIWGNVAAAGIWRVDRGVDFIRLLSAARLPGIGQDDEGVRRRVFVHVYRSQSDDRRRVYEERLDRIMERGADIPDLQDGDVLEIEMQQRSRLIPQVERVASFVGSMASLVLLYLRITERR